MEYDATINGSNHIYLNGTTQSVPYPVLHELSADLATAANPTHESGDAITTFTAVSNTAFDLAVTVVGTSTAFPRVNKQLTSIPIIGTKMYIEFDAVVNSGTCIITRVNIGGDIWITYTVVNGKNTIEITTTTSNALDSFYFDGTNLFDIEVTNWTVKEITLPTASYLTYFDSITNTLIELSSTGDVGDDLNPLPDFGNFTAGDAGTGFIASNEQATVVSNDTTPAYVIHSFEPIIGKRYRIIGELISTSETDAGKILFGGYTDTTIPVGDVDFTWTATTNGVLVLSNEVSISGVTLVWGTFTITEALPISTTYSVTDSHQFVFNHTSPLSAKDVEEIEADPNLAFRMFFDGEVLPSGFSRANDMVDCNFFGGNEGLASVAFIQDLGADLGSEEFTTLSVLNSSGNISVVDNGDGTYNITGTGTSTIDVIRFFTADSAIALDQPIYISLTAEVISGSLVIGRIYYALDGTAKVIDYPITDGQHYFYGLMYDANEVRLYTADLQTFEVKLSLNSIKEVPSIKIVDYDAATKTTLANQSNGASNLKLVRDGSGRTTGIALANTTQWEADGRTAVTNWTITAPFTITEIIDDDTYTYLSNGNRYKNKSPDGAYTVPTGIWTLDHTRFDGTPGVTKRGNTKMVDSLQIP